MTKWGDRSFWMRRSQKIDRHSMRFHYQFGWLYIAHWSRTRSYVPIYLVEKLYESCRTSSRNFQNDLANACLISHMVSPFLWRILGTARTALYLEKIGKVLEKIYHFSIELKTFIGIQHFLYSTAYMYICYVVLRHIDTYIMVMYCQTRNFN